MLGGGGSNVFFENSGVDLEGGDTSAEVNAETDRPKSNDEIISDTMNAQPVERVVVSFDLVEFQSLVHNLRSAADQQRRQVMEDIIAMGPEAIPHCQVAAARYSDVQIQLDMLFIESEIRNRYGEASNDSGVEKLPEGAEPAGRSTGAGEAAPASDGTKGQAPVVADIRDIAEDLIDINLDAEQVDRIVASRLAIAQRSMNEGNTQRAIALCEALMLLFPNSRYRLEIRQTLLDARTGAVADRHLAGSIRFERSHFVFADARDGSLKRKAKWTIYLTNVGRDTIELDFGDEGGKSRSMITFSLVAQEVTGTDNYISTEGSVSRSMALGKVTLAPGEHFQFSDAIDSLSAVSPGGGSKHLLTEVLVNGSIRPASMKIVRDETKRPVFRPISFTSGELRVLPAGFNLEQAQAAPVAFLKSELEADRLVNMRLMSSLIPESRYRPALDLLLSDTLLRAPLAQRETRIHVARVLTGKAMEPIANDWVQWWQQNRLRYRDE